MSPFVSEKENALKEEVERLENVNSEQRCRINDLETLASAQTEIIGNLETENEKLKDALQQILEKSRDAL